MVASLAAGRAIWTAVVAWHPTLKCFRVDVGWSGSVRYQTPDQLVAWLVGELYDRRVLAALPVPASQGSEDGPFVLILAR